MSRHHRLPASAPRPAPAMPSIPLALALAWMTAVACGVPKDKHEALKKEASEAQAKLTKAESEGKKQADKLRALEREAAGIKALSQAAEARAQAAQEATEALKKDFGARLKASEQEVEALAKTRLEAEEQTKLLKQLTGELDPLIKKRQISLTLVHGRMVIKLRSRVLFASNSARLLPDGKRALARLAAVLKGIKGSHFQVAGHTDDVRIAKGDYKDNWELSAARSLTVVQFLQGEGVPPDLLSAAGFAEFQPVARNKTPWGRQMNRRIEITLLPHVTREILEGPPKGGKGSKEKKGS